MQEEVNQKTIALCTRCAKMTADVLKGLMRKYLSDREKHKQEVKHKKAEKAAQEKAEKKAPVRGKQTLKKLMDQGSQLTYIEVTDNNIKSFDKVARKYGIDYSLRKDKSVEPPKYMVFFKAKDVDVMTKAFQEYSGVVLNKNKRVSIRKRLSLAKEKAAKQREREKTKQKDRGQSL